MRLRTFLLGAAMFSAALASAATNTVAAAQNALEPMWASPPARHAPLDRVQATVRPVREIVDMVRRQRGGELVDVLRLEQDANPPFYVLRWRFDNGVVADLRVNAVTGRIMG